MKSLILLVLGFNAAFGYTTVRESVIRFEGRSSDGLTAYEDSVAPSKRESPIGNGASRSNVALIRNRSQNPIVEDRDHYAQHRQSVEEARRGVANNQVNSNSIVSTDEIEDDCAYCQGESETWYEPNNEQSSRSSSDSTFTSSANNVQTQQRVLPPRNEDNYRQRSYSDVKLVPSSSHSVQSSNNEITSESSSSSSSRTESHTRLSSPRVVYVYINPSNPSSNDRRISSQSVISPFNPVIPSGSSSSYSHRDRFSNQGSTGVIPIAEYPRESSSSSSHFNSHSSSSSSSNSNIFESRVGLTAFPSSSHLAPHFGTGFRSSIGLSDYMTEAERLARQQAQRNTGTTNGNTGSSTVDIVRNDAVPVSSGSRSHSWEKSSRWASQSEYDSSGVRKSSGFLSTAEGEDTTINGKTTGYRAATTTVDDDGRRSTYSVHT